MATLTFDTYSFITHLKERGFKEDQARALADAMQTISLEQVSTKADIQEIKDEIYKLENQDVKIHYPNADWSSGRFRINC